MTSDLLRERLERIYPEGSFGDAVVKLHRDAERLLGREVADQMAQECFVKIDAARDKGLEQWVPGWTQWVASNQEDKP